MRYRDPEDAPRRRPPGRYLSLFQHRTGLAVSPPADRRRPNKSGRNKDKKYRTTRNVRKEVFLRAYVAEGGSIAGACRRLHGMSRQLIYDWRAEDPAFVEAMKQAEQAAVELLEADAYRRARTKSDVVLMWLLKKRRPEVYGDTPRVTPPPVQQHAFSVSSIKFSELSDEGLDLVGQVLKAIAASQQPIIDAQKQVEGRRL
jgi:hypothetical protein